MKDIYQDNGVRKQVQEHYLTNRCYRLSGREKWEQITFVKTIKKKNALQY